MSVENQKLLLKLPNKVFMYRYGIIYIQIVFLWNININMNKI
jgi:hypothetical protein